MSIERRFTLSVRAEGNAARPVLSGYASVFNSRSRKIPTARGSFYEQVAPGAFSRALRKGNTVANLYHDMTQPLGTVKAGTLRLEQDARGLLCSVDINPNVSYAMDAWHNAQTRSLSSMSFAFVMPEDGSGESWDDIDDLEDNERGYKRKAKLRTLRDVEDLQDIAFLTEGMGAYDEAACYADARNLFPNGTSELVEQRSAIVIPTTKEVVEVNEYAQRRARLLRRASLL